MNSVGRNAEEIASNFLKERGFQILERNYRCGHLEIDIIAYPPHTKSVIHIVEGRNEKTPLNLSELIGVSKQKFLISAAGSFLKREKICAEVVFDIVVVKFSKTTHSVAFIENAFLPTW